MNWKIRLLAIGLCFGLSASVVQAQSWLNAADGSWGVSGNWQGGAVPAGAALVAFTNSHAVTVTVTLDGNRAQTNNMLFGNGDWTILPGTPGGSTLTLGGGSILTVSNGVTTFGVAGQASGGGTVYKRGSGELRFANTRQFTNNTPSVEAGILRVAAGGALQTGATFDTYVDGTGSLIVDGGRIDTKIIRIGGSIMADGARFRMNSGTVNCGGSGNAVLLVGYTAGTPLQGSAYADILGGTFAATGSVDDAGIFIGIARQGTLTVTGTNGTPAAVNVGRIYFGWKDASFNYATTNLCDIGSNAVVSASAAVLKNNALGLGRLYLHQGGTLRTPTVYAAAGALDFHFNGGKLELTAPSNTLFAGAGMRVFADADSELDIGTNRVLTAAPFSGSAQLAKTGMGTLLFGGNQNGFAGTLAVQAGALVLSNLTGGASMAVRLGTGTTLDLTALSVLVPNLNVAGNASVTVADAGVTLSSLTLAGGTLMLPDNDYLTVLALDVPTGANVTLSSAGTVAVGMLTGGGTLTVAGGGTFNVVDDEAFTGSASAEAGTTLNLAASTVSRLTVSGAQTITMAGGKLTVSNLVFAGGTLTVAGGGELALGTVTVNDGAPAGFALTGGAVLTNVASLALGAGSVFQPSVAAGAVLSVGAATGTGTLRLDGGTVAIGALDTGMSFDIQSGNVTVQPLAGPDSVTYTSGEPAFWVDASETGSLVTVNGKLEWRDRRYNETGPYDMKATATGTQPTVTASDPELNGLSVVRFAAPSSGTFKGMAWSRRLTEIRTIFWVIGVQEGGGGLIGDESLIDFLRGEVPPGTGADVPLNIYYSPLFSLKFAIANRDHLQSVQNGVTRINGQVTDAFRNGFPSPDYHLVSLRTAGNTVGEAFASERTNSVYYYRSGCQRLAEALVFTNVLTDAEIAATEAYLQKKWFATSVRANTVRIGSVGAYFAAVGGKVIINELQVATPDQSPTNSLAGVDRIERMVVSASGVVLGNVARTALPYDVGELRVENGVTVTLDVASAGAVWLGALSGTGTVTVAGGTSIEVGGTMTAAGDDLTLDCSTVPLTIRSWKSAGALRVAGASGLKINSMDLSGSSTLAYAGAGPLQVTNDAIRASGVLNVAGNLSVVVNTLWMNAGNLSLNLDNGGRNVQVGTFYGSGLLSKTGTGSLSVGTQVRVENTSMTFAIDTFANTVLPRIALVNGALSVTGQGQLTVNELRTEINGPQSFAFATGVSMTVSNLNHTIGTLTLPTSGTLNIVNLTPSSDCAVVFPSNMTTVVRTLATTVSGRVVLQGGPLQVLSSITNVQRFSILNAGLTLPDGTVLAPSLFDVRANARIDLGVGSVLTLNVAGQAFSNGVTFVKGAVNVNESLSMPGTLRLEGTVMSVAAGKTLTAAALTGDGTLAVAAGGTLTLPNLNGFDGVLDNRGGTVNVNNDRIKPIPAGPVVSPTFWVDASQSGSLTTNAQSKLVWLDKRTVRDGTPGLMSATSLSNMPAVLQGTLNGLPVVDFGPLGTNATHEKGMLWSSRLTNVRAVHWVIGVQNGGGQMLGDLNSGGGDIDYFRYSDLTTGIYTNNFGYGDYRTPLWSGTRFYTRHYVKNIVDGTTYMNGTAMTAPGFTEGFPSPDYHLLSLRTTGQTWAAAFASERVGNTYGHRSGGQRLGEVLVYDTVTLTDTQNRDNDAYLSWKWFARRLPTYRVEGEDLVVLRGSGTVNGTSVLARELAPAAAGLAVGGNLYLDFYQEAAATGTVIRLASLPGAGVAAVGVTGNVSLSTRGTVMLGEARAGVFKVLAASGTLSGASNITGWSLDVSTAPHAAGYTFELYIQDNAVMLKIMAKGTAILIR